MVRPQRRVHGRAAVPHPAPAGPLPDAARLALPGARRRRQGGAHRRRGARHQRAGQRPGITAASQEMLQMVAAGTGDWLFLVDEDRRVQFLNRCMRSLPREKVIGQRIDEIAEGEDRPTCCAAVQQVLDTGEHVDVELGAIRPKRRASSMRAYGPCSSARTSRARSSMSPRSPTAARPRSCARPRRACSSCCTRAWSPSTQTT